MTNWETKIVKTADSKKINSTKNIFINIFLRFRNSFSPQHLRLASSEYSIITPDSISFFKKQSPELMQILIIGNYTTYNKVIYTNKKYFIKFLIWRVKDKFWYHHLQLPFISKSKILKCKYNKYKYTVWYM